MRNILLTVSYDGTHFCGWQKQEKADAGRPLRTVQGEIEKVLERIHHVAVPLTGSGRTDSGVHAVGQAANFFSPVDSIPVHNYIPAMNSMLPHDIRITAAKQVAPDFHARFSATSRTYRYFLCCGRQAYAHEMPYVWYIRDMPDIAHQNTQHWPGMIKLFQALGDEASLPSLSVILWESPYSECRLWSCKSTSLGL